MAVAPMPLWSYSTQNGSAFGSWSDAPFWSVQVNGFDPSHCWGACAATCPVEARLINQAVQELGSPPATVVAFTVDPAHDTPASVRAFLRKEKITARFRWVLGTKAQLAPVWKGYAVTPQRTDEEHMARIVLIDKRGMQRVGYPFDQTTPGRIAHDMRLLARE